MSPPNLQNEIDLLEQYASSGLDEEVQVFISNLILLGYRIIGLRSRHATQIADLFRAIVPVVTADKPNLIICRRLYIETELLVNWQRSVAMKVVYFVSGGGASSAALAGVVSAFLLAMLIGWFLLPEIFLDTAEPPPEISLSTSDGKRVVACEPAVGSDLQETSIGGQYTVQIVEHPCAGSTVVNLDEVIRGEGASSHVITEGNGDSALSIEDGALRVANSDLLDYEKLTERTVIIETGNESRETVDLTIRIADRNDAPIIPDHTYTVSGTISPGVILGELAAADQDDEFLTYRVVDDDDQSFDLDPETGRLTVSGQSPQGGEGDLSDVLLVEVSDDENATARATVIINHAVSIDKRLLQYDRKDLFALLVSAFLGSLASIVISLTSKRESANVEVYDPERVFVRAFFKPLIAMIFALAVFSVLKTGLVAVEGLIVSGGGEAHFHVLWVIGFFSGFSERFAPRIFGQVGGGGEARPPPPPT